MRTDIYKADVEFILIPCSRYLRLANLRARGPRDFWLAETQF